MVMAWNRVSRTSRWWICAVYLVLLAVLSLLPAWLFPSATTQVPGLDKLVHAGMYGVLGALFRWAADENKRWAARWWGLPLAGAGYGLLMECCQYGCSGGARTFSMRDAGANLLGIMVVWGWTGKKMGQGNPAVLRDEMAADTVAKDE